MWPRARKSTERSSHPRLRLLNVVVIVAYIVLQRRCSRVPGIRTLRFLLCLAASMLRAQNAVPMAQYDSLRTNANLAESVLNTTNVNVNQFGMLFTRTLDGYSYAHPLYVPNVSIAGVGIRNVVYVATLNNTVYAFDADYPNQT